MSRALLYCAGGGIGDSLVASVVARALRQRYQIVDALTLPGHRETLERTGDVDDVLVDDGGDGRALARTLAARGYDACVVTWATSRTAKVAQLAKIPVRVGQARRLYSFRFTHRVTVRSETGDTTSHWADILLDFARALGCDTPDHTYRFVPTPRDQAEADALTAIAASVTPSLSSSVTPSLSSSVTPSLSRGEENLSSVTPSLSRGDANHGFIILNPCNAIASKRGNWPVEGWAALARALHERYGARILISGGPADAAIAEAVLRQAQHDTTRRAGAVTTVTTGDATPLADDGAAPVGEDGAAFVSIAGKVSIGAFGALAKRARAFVGITTGSMHVAAAVGCPTVGIFPFQSDFPERWAPLGPQTAVVRPSYACHRGDTKEKCADYACIAHLDAARILAAADGLL